jgi:hypothetical protein
VVGFTTGSRGVPGETPVVRDVDDDVDNSSNNIIIIIIKVIRRV